MEIANIMLLLVIITNVAIYVILQAQVSWNNRRIDGLKRNDDIDTYMIGEILKRLETIGRKGEEE